MSHYPPPPSFGGPFTPNAHFTPSPSVTYPLMPHLPYHQMRDSNSQSQGQSAGLASTHYANSYGFNANQSSSRPGPPQSSYSGYWQNMNGSFPPPLFPPIPPPSFAATSPIHPTLHRHEASPASIQFQANLPVKPPPVSSLRVGATPENPQIPTAAISELEDGELSDGEERSRSKDSSLGNLKDTPASINGREELSSRTSSGDGRRMFQVSNAIDSGFTEGEYHPPHKLTSKCSPNGHEYSRKQNVPNGHESSSMQQHNKPTQSPKDYGASNSMQRFPALQNSWSTEVPRDAQLPSLEVTGPVQFKPMSTTQNRPLGNEVHQENALIDNPSLQLLVESATDIRGRAKDVLKELYPHEIGFAKLVEEGIDPKILHELYAEIGIHIHSSLPASKKLDDLHLPNRRKTDDTPKRTYFNHAVGNLSQGKADSDEFPRNGPQACQSPQVSEVSLQSLNAKKISNRRPSTSNSASNLGDNANDGNSSCKASIATAVRTLDSASKPGATTKILKAPAANLLGKSTNNKPGEKALERKDYIARMLAAKAGKPIPAAGTIIAADTLTEHPQVSTLETARSQGTETTGDIEERRLHVGNLSLTTTELDLKELFSGFVIISISIPKNVHSGSSVGHGFVELTSASEALRAISVLSKKVILNHQVSIELVRTMEKTTQNDRTTSSATIQPRTEFNQSSTAKDDVESKKRAQTELARQKMEALKSRDSNQSENQKHNGATTSIQSQHPSLGQSQYIEPQGGAVALQATHVSHSVPQNSNSAYSNSKSPFSIPGLFMAAATKDLVMSNAPPTFQASVVSDETEAKISSGIQISDSLSRVESYPSQPTEAKMPVGTSALLTNSVADVRSTTSKTGANEYRKRQKAADFIDSPSVRIKRTLGQNEDTSVIIEISEEEDNQESEEEEVDMDVDMETDVDEEMGQKTPLKESSSYNHESAKPRGIRDLPPLSDFPSRKKMAPIIAIMTPPASHTPTKNKEPEDLKLKEKEIELMNRKIAELEQRIKAKQTASRAQTPEKPGFSRTSPQELGVLAATQEPLKSGVLVVESSREASKETELRILSAMEEAPEIVNEIEAVNDIESILKAEAAQKAKVAHEVRAADEAKAAQEAKVAKAAQEAELAEQAKIAQAAKVAEQERIIIEQRANDLEQIKIDVERSRVAEAATIAEEEQRRLRRNEIEFGLPLLDAEVERTKQKLKNLKRQMENLESEVQKGVEGRRILMEELIGLAPNPTSLITNEKNHEIKTDIQILKANEGLHRISTPDRLFDSVRSQSKANTQEGHGEPNSPSLMLHSPRPTAQISENEPLIDQQQGNSMDMNISCTNIDEGEVTDYSPDRPTNFSSAGSLVNKESIHEQAAVVDHISKKIMSQLNDDDIYEPPTILDAEKFSGGEKKETEHPEKENSNIAHNVPVPDVNGPLMPHGLNNIGNSSEVVSTQDEEGGSNRSLPLADASDSDDYEPPEPISPVETATLQSSGKSTSQELFLPNPSGNIKDTFKNDMLVMPPYPEVEEPNTVRAIIGLEPKSDAKNPSNSDKGQFTPYESPLKQFKSYRFNPEYLSEVPRGFRSLTYSHGINSDKPLCRYEVAGGVCNDDSCEGQHVRSLGLSDNMILVQMGAIPEGLNQGEGDAYAAGLRQIIQEIRGRKVTDFNIVASEIAAYRAKFLGETIKALAL